MIEWFCYGIAIGAVMGGSIGALIVTWIIAVQDRALNRSGPSSVDLRPVDAGDASAPVPQASPLSRAPAQSGSALAELTVTDPLAHLTASDPVKVRHA